ncbi:MAG TPA: ABC transporter permease [Acidobacteriota bacterium]|nr:ABC transporter permease [Acidobacteriota bacterium]
MRSLIESMFPLATKYMRDLKREKTIGLFFSLLFFIALSVSLLILTVSFIYNPEYLINGTVPVGVVGPIESIPFIRTIPKANITLFTTESEGIDALVNGSIDGLVTIDTPPSPYFAGVLRITTPSSPVTSSVILSLLKPALELQEQSLQSQRDVNNEFIWTTQIQARPTLKGANVIYEIILAFIVPLFVLIPAFVIGNMFVDSLTQDIEQKVLSLLLTVISPARIVFEYVIFGVVASSSLVAVFLAILYLRFAFLNSFGLVMLYAVLFSITVFIFAIVASLVFVKKEIAQIVYSFAIVSIFLLSPFIKISPLYTITELLLGNTSHFFSSILALAVVASICGVGLFVHLRKNYY